MFAALTALLYATVVFRELGSFRYAALAGVASVAASLTRYEGWFLIPFVFCYFLIVAPRRSGVAALLFGAIACVGPLYWLAHNWWYFGDALSFYRGPYGPRAIQGDKPYPGLHNWGEAWLYYRSAIGLVMGMRACVLGAAGIAVALWKRIWWPVLFLVLPPAFYLWSMESSGGSPIFIPTLWPHSYYNTRYGLAALPLLAFGAGALVLIGRARWRPYMAAAVVVGSVVLHSVCWKESEVNSVARRAWTHQSAEYLQQHYAHGTGIFAALGDQAGVFREAGIPFRDVLQEGNGPAWLGAVGKPNLLLNEGWALAIEGDAVWRTVSSDPRYVLEKSITVPGAPAVEIYRLN